MEHRSRQTVSRYDSPLQLFVSSTQRNPVCPDPFTGFMYQQQPYSTAYQTHDYSTSLAFIPAVGSMDLALSDNSMSFAPSQQPPLLPHPLLGIQYQSLVNRQNQINLQLYQPQSQSQSIPQNYRPQSLVTADHRSSYIDIDLYNQRHQLFLSTPTITNTVTATSTSTNIMVTPPFDISASISLPLPTCSTTTTDGIYNTLHTPAISFNDQSRINTTTTASSAHSTSTDSKKSNRVHKTMTSHPYRSSYKQTTSSTTLKTRKLYFRFHRNAYALMRELLEEEYGMYPKAEHIAQAAAADGIAVPLTKKRWTRLQGNMKTLLKSRMNGLCGVEGIALQHTLPASQYKLNMYSDHSQHIYNNDLSDQRQHIYNEQQQTYKGLYHHQQIYKDQPNLISNSSLNPPPFTTWLNLHQTTSFHHPIPLLTSNPILSEQFHQRGGNNTLLSSAISFNDIPTTIRFDAEFTCLSWRNDNLIVAPVEEWVKIFILSHFAVNSAITTTTANITTDLSHSDKEELLESQHLISVNNSPSSLPTTNLSHTTTSSSSLLSKHQYALIIYPLVPAQPISPTSTSNSSLSSHSIATSPTTSTTSSHAITNDWFTRALTTTDGVSTSEIITLARCTSPRSTLDRLKQRFQTRRSRCGVTAIAIDFLCSRCTCQCIDTALNMTVPISTSRPQNEPSFNLLTGLTINDWLRPQVQHAMTRELIMYLHYAEMNDLVTSTQE